MGVGSWIVQAASALLPDSLYWDWRARHYAEEFASLSPMAREGFEAQERAIVQVVYGLNGVRLAIEAGCGLGRVARRLHGEIEGLAVLGTDASWKMIQEAEIHSTHLLRFMQIPIWRLCSRVDLVYSVEVLMHVRDPWPAMRRMLTCSTAYVLHCELTAPGSYCRRNYAHDYVGIYARHGIHAKVVAEAPFGQSIIVASKETDR